MPGRVLPPVSWLLAIAIAATAIKRSATDAHNRCNSPGAR